MKTPKINPENEFLLRTLTVICDMLALEKVFEPDPYNTRRIIYSQSHLDEVGGRIAENLNARYHNCSIYATNETQSYSIALQEGKPQEMLKDLKCLIQKTFRVPGIKVNMPKDYEFNPKHWREIAEQFESADEILTSREYLIPCENLEQAQIHLNKFKEQEPDNKKAIQNLTNTVVQWAEHVKIWSEIHAIANTIDYVALAEVKKERATDKLANENKVIKTMIESDALNRENMFLQYVRPRAIYDTFKKFDLEPVNDLNLYLSLQAAETINTETESDTLIWNELHDQVIGKKPGGLKFKTFDNYLLYLQIKAKDLSCKIQDDFYKKNGCVKSLSHRKYQELDRLKANLKKDNFFIDLLIKNEQTINNYINK